MKIPFLDLTKEYQSIKKEIDEALHRVIESGAFILGPQVKEFEQKIAEYLGVAHAIGVSSGTDALTLSLRALAIKRKKQEFFNSEDEIITTPFTFTATGSAILRSGAKPVFTDIDPDSYNLNPTKVREYLKKNPSKVVGILPVHIYGQSASMGEIMALAKEYNLFVVEDTAQAMGGEWEGKKLGTLGDVGAFSFFPTKNLGCFGDGGLVATGDDELAELVRMLMRHGGQSKYNALHVGYNSRLDTLQAAVLLEKQKHLDSWNQKRREVAKKYRQFLSGVKDIILPADDPSHVYHQFTLRISEKRKELMDFLKNQGIPSMVYYPIPLHQMEVFKRDMKAAPSLSETEKACAEVLSLPISPFQEEEITSFIGEKVREGMEG